MKNLVTAAAEFLATIDGMTEYSEWEPEDRATRDALVAAIREATAGTAPATPNGYDPRWVAAINGVLEDREVDVRITDVTDELWERFIGPLVDAIEDGDDDEEDCPECARENGPHYAGPCAH